jgi:hypothetical protein
LRSTSGEFVRSAARLVHLPVAEGESDVVFSAVLRTPGFGRTPVLSLYADCNPVLRTLSSEMLLHTFLSELRGRALTGAADRLYLNLPIVRVSDLGLLLPSVALRRLVRLERAAKRLHTDFLAVPALTIGLKTGRPVPGLASLDNGPNGSSIESIDAIAVKRTREGRLPSRAEVLYELAQRARNLRSVGADGLEALGLLVERAKLIEWDETRPDSMLGRLTEESLFMERAG